MVRIINPIVGQSPLAGTISDLGKALFSPLSSSESLQRENARKVQRENAETEALSQLVIDRGGVQDLGADPMAQALQIASGYDPNKFGRLGAIGAATGKGINHPNTSEWLVGLGDGAASPWNLNANRAQAESQFARTLSETMRQFDQKPMEAIVDGQPVFRPQAGMFEDGVAPILSETDQKGTLLGANFDDLDALSPAQQTVLGADAAKIGTTRNYITPNGTFLVNDQSIANGVDVRGNPLPPGGYIGTVQGSANEAGVTNAVLTDVQSDNIATQKFKGLINMARPLTDNPELFGAPGMIRSAAQDVIQSLGGVANMVGQAEAELSAQGLAPEALRGLIPELYDPRLSEVETLWGLLLYQGAMSLAGQQGRSVSDADVQMMRGILGDPHSLFASNLSMRSKLDIAERVIDSYSAVNDSVLRDGIQPGTVPATAPAGMPTVSSDEEYDALPPGTLFLAPDGTRRRKP